MGDVLDFERTDPFSVSCWFRTLSSSLQFMVAKQEAAAPTGWALFMSGGKVQFEMINTFPTNYVNVLTDVRWNDGNWHHALATYDGSSSASGSTIYIDGVAAATSIGADSLSASTLNAADLYIGSRELDHPTNGFQGSIADVAIFDKELSSVEVDTVYNGGEPADVSLASFSGNLVGYWRMGDEDTYPTILDRSVPLTGAEYSPLERSYNTWGASAFPATEFSGVPNYNWQDAVSVQFWVNPDNNSFNKDIMGMGSGVASADYPWKISREGQGFKFQIRTGGNISSLQCNSNPLLPSGSWYHIVFAKGASEDPNHSTERWEMYVNGVKAVGRTVLANVTGAASNRQFRYGNIDSGHNFIFDGRMCHIAIWGRKITQAEATLLYGSGVPQDLDHPDLSSLQTSLQFWHGVAATDDFDNVVDGVKDISGNDRHGTGNWENGIETDVPSLPSNDGTMTNMEAGDIRGDSPANPLLLFKLGSQNADTALGTADMITERAAASVGNELDSASPAYPMVPISLISGYGYRGMHGYLDDLFWGTDVFDTDPGNTYPAQTSNRQFAQASHVIHPWCEDNTPPYFGISTSEPHTAVDGHFTGVDEAPEDAKVEYFQMVAIDDGAPIYPTYVSWVVSDTPDTDGTFADPEFGPISNIQISARWIEDS
jgi:hypothetical protein